MNPDRLTDWQYFYEERLGIMCGTAEPTKEQDEAAKLWATEYVRSLDTQKHQ